jgi:hypothetical protein
MNGVPECGEDHIIGSQPDDCFACLSEQRDELQRTLRMILAEPHGCPMCDSGALRNKAKEHWNTCGFARARQILGEGQQGENPRPQEPVAPDVVACGSDLLVVAPGLASYVAEAEESPALRDAAAARSTAQFVREFGARQRHAEAVADCAHCNLTFLAGWVLDVLGPEPLKAVVPGPPDPPCRAKVTEPTPHTTPQRGEPGEQP